MRISEFSALLDSAFKESLQLLVVGPAGVGKTQAPQDWCNRNGWDWHAVCMPLADPPFLMGYPFRENGHAGHAPFGVLDKCLNATKPTLLILDEIGGATSTVIKAGLRLLQFKEVCGRRMPDCVKIIAMSNDIGHGADVLGMVEPMKDRFISIINVEPHVDDTVAYGLANGWPAWLLAFLRNSPDCLHDLKPMKSMQRSGATPRGWEGVSKLDRGGFLNMPIASELICGAVGKGAGTKALAFRELVNELPDVDACILSPETSPVPDNPSARYLVSMALATKVTAGNFGQCLKYLNRLPAMFRACAIRDAFRGEQHRKREGTLPKGWAALASSRDFTAWVCSEDGKVVMAAAS